MRLKFPRAVFGAAAVFGGVVSNAEGGSVENIYFVLPPPQPAPVSLDLRSHLLQPRSLDLSGYRDVLVCGGVIDFSVPFACGLIDLFGSADEFRTALAADTVVLVELKPTDDLWTAGEEISATAIEVSAVDAATLRAALTYDATYNWQPELYEVSQYGIRVKFAGAGKTVAVDLCIAGHTARGTKTGGENSVADFEFGFPNVAAVVARYFPRAVGRLDFLIEDATPAESPAEAGLRGLSRSR